MLFEKLAKNITDMPGVEGLCLIDSTSELLYSHMPAFIPESAFAEASRRVLALYETIDENFLPADDYLLKFSGKNIVLRRIENIILLLLTNDEANTMSLRMVTNMVMKHVQSTPEVTTELRSARAAATQASPAAASPTLSASPAASVQASSTSPAPAPEAPSKKPVRIYRGQIVED